MLNHETLSITDGEINSNRVHTLPIQFHQPMCRLFDVWLPVVLNKISVQISQGAAAQCKLLLAYCLRNYFCQHLDQS